MPRKRSMPAAVVVLVAPAALLSLVVAASLAFGAPSATPAKVSTKAGLKKAKWAANVRITYGTTTVRYRSNGLPNHARQAQYAVPTGPGVPSAANATAIADPSKTQAYDFTIPTTPTRSASVTPTGGGTIGVMISGASLFNPYEGDGVTVAVSGNFAVTDASGEDVAFLDSCNGHPSPNGAYHYHALPTCITATVDKANGASHIIGIAFDGYPIYGDRSINGKRVSKSKLDRCNGVTSPTPEFPKGIYHYVLLSTRDSTSSIRCFHGKVDPSLVAGRPLGMAGMMLG